MVSDHVRWRERGGKGWSGDFLHAVAATVIAVTVTLLPAASRAESRKLELLLGQPPASLNPRSTLDATGQHVNALLYSGLTRIDADLKPEPDLARSWSIRGSGREIHFRIRDGIADHSGRTITAKDLSACLEEYRTGKPASPYQSSFPHWKGTRHSRDEVILTLDAPDPYLFRNLSLLRYFRSPSRTIPCVEPAPGEALIGSGPFRMEPWDPHPESELSLVPVLPGHLPVHLQFVVDDNTRVLRLLRGDVDATLDSLSLTKERWVQSRYADRFRLIERPGTRVSYLAFNLRDPVLSDVRVRRAIALAIHREEIVRYKLFGFANLAGSLLAPQIEEALELPFGYDPALSEKLLDEAGYPRKADGTRFELRYKTTYVREGFEAALMFREMLKRVGVRLVLDVVEPAVFLQSVRKGNYQLISSYWIGIADGSILYRTLDSHSPDNRAGYRNPEVDALLERAMGELDPVKRARLMKDVQRIMARDLPYFPLWFWNEGLIVRKDDPRFEKIRSEDLSLSRALEPLLILR